MDRTTLLVTAASDAQDLATVLSREADVVVEIVSSRRAALASLRRRRYDVVLLDSVMEANEVTTADQLWTSAGNAVPLELPLSELQAKSVSRLLRHMLKQFDEGRDAAKRAGALATEERLRSTLTAFLLQSDLLLREKLAPLSLLETVRRMQEATQDLRARLC